MPWTEFILPAASAALSAAVISLLWKWDVIRPGSFPAKRGRDVGKVPGAVWLLCALVVYLSLVEGQIIMSALPASVLGAKGSMRSDALVSAGTYLTAIIAGVLVIFLLRERAGERAGLSVGRSDVGRGTIAIVLTAPVCIFVSWAGQVIADRVTGVHQDDVAHLTLKRIIEHRGSGWTWLIAAGAVVGAPVVEEILYRGLLQSCLLNVLGRGSGKGDRAGRGTWAAIIGTSAVFAAMHVSAVPVQALATLFVLGVAMGAAYERTRSLGVPITMHVLFNAGNVAAALVLKPDGR